MSFGRASRLVAVGLGGLAVVLALVCAVDVVRVRTFLAESAVAAGQVVELVETRDCPDAGTADGCRTLWAPRVVFTTADGRDVDVVSTTAEAPPAYAEGDLVDVRYRPERPTDVAVGPATGVWRAAVVTGGLAALFAGLYALWVVRAVRSRGRATEHDGHP